MRAIPGDRLRTLLLNQIKKPLDECSFVIVIGNQRYGTKLLLVLHAAGNTDNTLHCLLYTSPSPRDS